MNSDLVTQERRGAAVVLRLAGIDAKGMFGASLLRSLTAAIDGVANDPGVRAIVLTGVGDLFCAGGNVGNGPGAREAFIGAFRDALLAMDRSSLPIIAAINGRCTAGGMTLIGSTDYAITVDNAMFGYSELAIGAFPLLALVTVPAHLPKKVFFELAYSAELITAKRMLELDLVNRAVRSDALWGEVDAFVTSLAEKSSVAITRGRSLYYTTLGATRVKEINVAAQALTQLPAVDHYK